MARETTPNNEDIDIDGLRQLMELMEKHDVSELKLQRGVAKYMLRRGPQVISAGHVPTASPLAAAPVAPAAASSESDTTGASGTVEEHLLPITSPTVGTFYQAPSPDEPAFVKVGDSVHNATIVCIVEAMKVFNQIPAEVAGTITKILVKDGDPVEFGQTLFLVQPS